MVSAAQAKVPVVIIDSDLKTDKYVSFVATDNFKGGQLAAERIGELLGGKGNVILLRYAVGSASTEARESGFLDTLKEKFPGIKIISSTNMPAPPAKPPIRSRKTSSTASAARRKRSILPERIQDHRHDQGTCGTSDGPGEKIKMVGL